MSSVFRDSCIYCAGEAKAVIKTEKKSPAPNPQQGYKQSQVLFTDLNN